MARIHSADIARRAGKTAPWLDDKLRWIKKYKPELWAELEAQEAARKSQLETTSSNSQTAWTLTEVGTSLLPDHLGLPSQEPEPLADILESAGSKACRLRLQRLDNHPHPATSHPITQQKMGHAMNIKFPLKHSELPISAAHANEWKAVLIERMSTLSKSMLDRLHVELSVSTIEHIVFWSEQSLAWALMYLPPAALTASERASWAIALVPENKDRLLSTLNSLHEDADRLSEKLQSLSVDAAALAAHVKPTKQATHGRVTDYVSPEAIAMYRAISAACASSRFPHRRHMCKEWRDDYKAFERYFLNNNVVEKYNPDAGAPKRFIVDKEGIIACVLDDPDSLLHGQVVYGPSTVMFVSKATQNFYNRTKRGFRAKLDEIYAKGHVSEAEYNFMAHAVEQLADTGAGKWVAGSIPQNTRC